MTKLEQNLDRLREILLEGPKKWGEIRGLTGWSKSVQKKVIDFLEGLGELTTTTGKRKGRRTTLYLLSNEERTKAKRAKYAAIEFIERMGTPVYAYAEKEKTTISAFVTTVRKQNRESVQKIANNIAKKFNTWALSHVRKTLSTKQKLAIVLTVES